MSARSPSHKSVPQPINPTSRRLHGASLWLGFLAVVALPGILCAQTSGTLRIVGVECLPGNQLRLVFHEAGTNVLDYRLTHQSKLEAGTTNYLDLQARIANLGEGYYQTIIPPPPTSPRFYRITGFSGSDSDGDGLSDALEGWVGTSATTFDTDGDGLGDGVELVRGGSPLDANSQPLIVQPNFALGSSAAREGDAALNLAVSLNANYRGTLRYRIADISTAIAGEDFAPVSGSVIVNGSNTVIQIALLDDTTIESVKILAVDLVEDAGADYQVGGSSRHLVTLYDNDTLWSGVMGTANSAQLGFRLRMLRVGNQIASAALVSELSTNSSRGLGTIPVGVWPVQATLTANSFQAVSDPIPVGTSLLTGNAQLQRRLTFTAGAGATNTLVRSNLITGKFTDRLVSSDPGMRWVGGTVSGVFVLMEELPVLSPLQLPGATGLGGEAVARIQGGGQ